MSSDKMIKKGTLMLGLMLTACTGGLSGGSAPAVASPSLASVGGSIRDIGPVGSESYNEGYALGNRNGSILADRLKKRTVDLEGCSAVGDLENALLRVTRTIRPPARSSDQLVGGFYSGYLDAIRETIADARYACDETVYSSGEYAGQLIGAVACQVATVSVTAVSSLQLQPLYSGWSGGSSSVRASCRATLETTLQACSDGASSVASILASVQVSCSD